MKRILVALCLLGLVFALAAEESAYYPVRVNVYKVYSHAEGYRVVYQKGQLDAAEVYIPASWFVPGGKAEIVRGHDSSYPYMVVLFKDGVFSHLRLFVSSNAADPTWGVLRPEEGKDKFGAEDIKFQF